MSFHPQILRKTHNYQRFAMGWMNFSKPGRYRVSVSCLEGNLEKAALRSIHFTPLSEFRLSGPVPARLILSSLLSLLMAGWIVSANGATYYVDAKAGPAGTGTIQTPFSTIRQAADLLKAGDECVLREGVYRETVVPARSGTSEAPIVFRAHRGEKAVITGCDPLQKWTQEDGNIYCTEIEMNLGHENQVFADGQMMWEARWPNVGGRSPRQLLEFATATMDQGTTPTRIVDKDLLPDGDWSGASLWIASHKRWYCWTGRVTGHGKGFVALVDNSDKKGNHVCTKGGQYYLFGAKAALDAENEWYYDKDVKRLYAWVPGGRNPLDRVEVKRRQWAFDLRGRRHIQIRNLTITGASLVTDDQSEHLTLDGLRIFYPYHSCKAEKQYESQRNTGIILGGKGHVVRGCEIAFSSGDGLSLPGRDCHVINNYIHDCNYMGTYAAPLNFALGGRGHVVSHNTITRAGRSCIGTTGLYDCLLQYNDVSFSGYLTDDLGLTYGNGVEGGNSEVRYNWFRDNVATSHNMGLYFDHGCKNVILHHNVISGASHLGMINNQYANYLLYYNNTVSSKGYSYCSTWAAGQKKDLYGCRLFNNVGTKDIRVDGQGIVMGSNSWNYGQLLEHKYLTPESEPVNSGIPVEGITGPYIGKAPDRGAYEMGGKRWEPGHDFEHPPEEIDMQRSRPHYRNLIRNAALYRGQTDFWTLVGKQVEIIEDFHGQWVNNGKTMMGGYSVSLGDGGSTIRQTVEALAPNTTYELMGMFRVDGNAKAFLAISDDTGRKLQSKPVSNTQTTWQRRTLPFTTGPEQTCVIVIAERAAEGTGCVYVDDMGLQRQD